MKKSEQKERFHQCMVECQPILHKVALSFASTASDQDDLLQELMLAIWNALPAFKEGSKLSTYVYRVCLNRAISWQRKCRADAEKVEKLSGEPLIEQGSTTGDRRIEALYAAIRNLKQLDRSLVVMHLDGYSYQEIGDVLGLSAGNVGARLSRARKNLGNQMKGESNE